MPPPIYSETSARWLLFAVQLAPQRSHPSLYSETVPAAAALELRSAELALPPVDSSFPTTPSAENLLSR